MRSSDFGKSVLGLVLGILCTGCGGNSVADREDGNVDVQANIAVVDVNLVAKQIGAMDKIEYSMAEFELKLKSELADIKDRLDGQFEAKKATMNNDLNSQAQGELDALLVTHQNSLNQETAIRNNQLAVHHNKLKMSLMEQVRPVAYQIATEKGMSIVLTTSQIYAAGPTADITQEVVQRILKMHVEAQKSGAAQAPQRVANLQGGGEFKAY